MARILVMEDEDQLRTMLQEMLRRVGHEVVTAPDGRAGIALYSRDPVDVVITDIMMPNQDGFEAIQELCFNSPSVKIIAITGWGLHLLPVAYDLGAFRVLEKPFKKEDILKAVEEAMEEGG